jgi:hypothetical protein
MAGLCNILRKKTLAKSAKDIFRTRTTPRRERKPNDQEGRDEIETSSQCSMDGSGTAQGVNNGEKQPELLRILRDINHHSAGLIKANRELTDSGVPDAGTPSSPRLLAARSIWPIGDDG